MHNLIRFIKLNQFLLLFLIIEGFSVFLLLSNNSYQANKIINYSTQYTSLIRNYSHSLTDYVSLKQTNDYLVAENAKLYSVLKHEESFHDSILVKNKLFSYQSAKVINNSISKRNNFITLNKGRKHGIKEGMGVVTHQGVIGIIHSVSKNYSIAISLLHRKSSLGICYNWQNSVNFLADYVLTANDSQWNLGSEMWFYDIFAARLGMLNEKLTAGFGLKTNNWSIDGAVIAHAKLGSTYRISIGLKFGGVI